MTELAKKIDVPETVDPLVAATLKWTYDEIRNADGLAIFVHPTWITGNTFHDSDALNDWLVENKIFDAFEVLGGKNYYEQNVMSRTDIKRFAIMRIRQGVTDITSSAVPIRTTARPKTATPISARRLFFHSRTSARL